MEIKFKVETPVSQSARVKQLGAMFDVPLQKKSTLEWRGDFPFDDEPWNVGLIVGPSGCGKTQIMRHVFGEREPFTWTKDAVIDDFRSDVPMTEISEACSAVGFNTIPSWMRPHRVLSNGEQFRVDLARSLVEVDDPIVIDEFTSVVDRQVAQIGSHALQKFVRKRKRKFVAVTCHYDVVEWLQPDWVLEPATMSFSRRLLRRRPELSAEIRRVPHDAWRLFAPYHYLTADLNKAAQCFALFVNGEIASFGGCLYRPHPKTKDIIGLSRLVTLPDWQGLGLAMILTDALGAAFKACGKQFRTYPAHPSLIRAFDKSPVWAMKKQPGVYSRRPGATSSMATASMTTGIGDRPCAVFAYAGPTMDASEARRLLAGSYGITAPRAIAV